MSSSSFELPELPAPHEEFIAYLAKNPTRSISDLVSPYNVYESKLREGFAQHHEHTILQNPHVNAVPIFDGYEDKVLVRRRSLESETENQKFVMPLKAEDRKPNGSPAIVQSMKNFVQNFNIFSESSLVDLSWNNVVAAGSSVVTSLLPVPDQYNKSKRALREYYHQKLAPSSDVDLFIWGLDETAAAEKIKEIETRIRNSILAETTTIRTKNAITIASQYPTRHVQIVLRLYKSVSEILTGFDVDCSIFAYDGSQVFGVPRGIAAFMTQINTVDLSRRSPSYESRLSKYSHRGFEVCWPFLERQRIDPTIFERSFVRTVGLARLLVLEALPKSSDREKYLDQRRAERGRPNLNRWRRDRGKLPDNVKDREPDDVAEWVYEDDVSNYHTFTVPYGPKYHAKRIERLLYTKDILLNAEWNTKKDRTAPHLHRHPCFIGDAASVLKDCCGFCPEPITDEEREIIEEESKIYVHGDLRFMTDDPGRQAIGSFNPITDDDWTDMAYIGNTAQLCQAICNHDLAYVQEWCSKEGSVIDRRDHTGRTPLHLATQCSTPEIVQCLIDNGARLVARLVDGITALHIAAARGSTQIVQALLERSEANEDEESKSKSWRATINTNDSKRDKQIGQAQDDYGSDEDANEKFDEDMSSDNDTTNLTQGSFVKITVGDPKGESIPDSETESQDPDIYDVNVLAWDAPISPLHLAILEDHVPVIEQLISRFGADVLLPVKILDSYSNKPSGAIMTLVLAAQLPHGRCAEVSKSLLRLGASSAQADMSQVSALHHIITRKKVDVLKLMFEVDAVAANGAMNHVAVSGYRWSATTTSPLISAIDSGNADLVKVLLDLGAKPRLDFDDWVGPFINSQMDQASGRHGLDNEEARNTYKRSVTEPVLLAVHRDLPVYVECMLEKDADVNAEVPSQDGGYVRHSNSGQTLLDIVESKIHDLQASPEGVISMPEPLQLEEDNIYLGKAIPGTYEHWSISKDIKVTHDVLKEWQRRRGQEITNRLEEKGLPEKKAKLRQLRAEFENLQEKIVQHGGKSFKELHPNDEAQPAPNQHSASQEKKVFNPRVSFQLPDLTDQKREGYTRLFEAVWRGDEATVKEMTLGSWGPTQQNIPLQIAVQDTSGLSPFSIAIHRQHRHLAKVILDIASVQYQPSDANEPKRHFVINNNSEDDDDDVSISSELMDNVFTIENIAALSKAVGSKVEPRKMIAWRAELWRFSKESDKKAEEDYQSSINKIYIPQFGSTESAFEQITRYEFAKTSLISQAVVNGDLDLLQFLIQCHTDISSSPSYQGTSVPAGAFEDIIQRGDLYSALEKGYFEIAAELIKSTGVGLQSRDLATQADDDISEKPKYYQGLTVYGSKRKEWAKDARGRNGPVEHSQENHPPFLEVIYQGCHAGSAWLLSEAPILYKQFSLASARSPDEQKKLHHAITSWLATRRHLALHCAVMSRHAPPDLIRYLIQAVPESLEAKSVSGHTPLSLAFSIGRVEAAQELLAAGAGPMTRDIIRRNIGHLVLQGVDGSIQEDASIIRNLLQLLDKSVAHEIFLERCKEGQGALTPLARSLRTLTNNSGSTIRPAVLEVLHEFTSGEDFVLMDASGQFPLHQAVKASHFDIVEFFIRKNPSLLMRENAMGQTPLELAASMFVLHSATTIPSVGRQNYHSRPTPIQEREAHTFLPDYTDENTKEHASVRVYRLCKETAADHPCPRKLVSVAESSEVARRLALRETQPEKRLVVSYRSRYRKTFGEEEEKEEEPVDEVTQWYPGNVCRQLSIYGIS